jgi:hypothetical protein
MSMSLVSSYVIEVTESYMRVPSPRLCVYEIRNK